MSQTRTHTREKDILLQVKDLKTYFYTDDGIVRAVDGVNFVAKEGQSLGIVGESGCGKSVTAYSILQIVSPPGRIEGGHIYYEHNNETIDIATLSPHSPKMRDIRGKEIAMIFQEPMTAFNPVYTIGNQIMEVIMLHENTGKKEARARTIEILQKVGMPASAQKIDAYPHELSGGMCQRAMIAMALSCDPHLLIADEPTSAIDVTIQVQILSLIRELQEKHNISLIMITHDLGVTAEICDQVAVMYMGKVVEFGDAHTIYHNTKHPYTIALLNSIPLVGVSQHLISIKGSVPDFFDMPSGCSFTSRCPEASLARSQCYQKEPPTVEVEPGHKVKCWIYC